MRLLLLPGLLLGLSSCSAGPQVIVCEQAEHRIALMSAEVEDWSQPEALTWEWRALEAPQLSEEQRQWFTNPTDAKPVFRGQFLLVTASGGGVALIDAENGAPAFVAYAGGNPHSAELLPDGSVVSASSTGNALKLWAIEQPDAPLQSVELRDAHGVCWDDRGKRLWAIGAEELVALAFGGKDEVEPLKIVERYTLPDPGGHDLAREAYGPRLLLSTLSGVWIFDPDTVEFTPYPGLANTADVKSVSEPAHLSDDNPTLVVRAEDSWWTNTLQSSSQDWQRHWPDSRIYKARWMSIEPYRSRRESGLHISVGFGAIFGVYPD